MSATPPDATESLRADAAALRTVADRVEAGEVDEATRMKLWLTLSSVQRVHDLLGEVADVR